MRLFYRRETATEKIERAAYILLGDRGYANVSMRDIAAKAGVALSQLTYYYRTREGLFLAVISKTVDGCLKALEELIKPEMDKKQRLETLWAGMRSLAGEEEQRFFKLLTDFMAQSAWVPSFRQQLDRLCEKSAALLSINMEGEQAAVRLALGAVYGVVLQRALGMAPDTAEEAMDFGGLLLDKI